MISTPMEGRGRSVVRYAGGCDIRLADDDRFLGLGGHRAERLLHLGDGCGLPPAQHELHDLVAHRLAGLAFLAHVNLRLVDGIRLVGPAGDRDPHDGRAQALHDVHPRVELRDDVAFQFLLQEHHRAFGVIHAARCGLRASALTPTYTVPPRVLANATTSHSTLCSRPPSRVMFSWKD